MAVGRGAEALAIGACLCKDLGIDIGEEKNQSEL